MGHFRCRGHVECVPSPPVLFGLSDGLCIRLVDQPDNLPRMPRFARQMYRKLALSIGLGGSQWIVFEKLANHARVGIGVGSCKMKGQSIGEFDARPDPHGSRIPFVQRLDLRIPGNSVLGHQMEWQTSKVVGLASSTNMLPQQVADFGFGSYRLVVEFGIVGGNGARGSMQRKSAIRVGPPDGSFVVAIHVFDGVRGPVRLAFVSCYSMQGSAGFGIDARGRIRVYRQQLRQN
mmetsp:Transcript_1566/g.3276  ORF Transcript_1566/g.3276 Transcript_1566/m.3276 type:complete len:233 (-) Transcript_1566:1006-1704(-)